MNIHTITKSLYGFFGSVFMVIGVSVILFKTGLLPMWAQNTILKVADNTLNGIHLIQELGSLLMFAGLISFWFIRNYEQSLAFH